MDLKQSALAFDLYPTFVILTSSMDTIPKTVKVVALNFQIMISCEHFLYLQGYHKNSYEIVNCGCRFTYNTSF